MPTYFALAAVSMSFLTTVGLLCYFLLDRKAERRIAEQSRNDHHHQLTFLTEVLKESQREKGDLLNRLMAGDLRSYQTMTHLQGVNSPQDRLSEPYISASDMHEIARINAANGGLGYPVYDEETDMTEMRQTLADMGMFPGGDPQ